MQEQSNFRLRPSSDIQLGIVLYCPDTKLGNSRYRKKTRNRKDKSSREIDILSGVAVDCRVLTASFRLALIRLWKYYYLHWSQYLLIVVV